MHKARVARFQGQSTRAKLQPGFDDIADIGFKPQNAPASFPFNMHQRGDKGSVFHLDAVFSAGVTR